ncbi:sialate O-acetylesterase, partial [Pirellulales bacterium]|nr:sialate O-acetylesterase [Pirellulales bacterium]
VGWGGTRVEEWLPGVNGPAGAPLYNRLRDALQALGPDGARAVLWHQGESDNSANTSTTDYRERLETIIAQSRIDAGFDVPWGVAQASFLPGILTDQNIIDAQQQVADNDPLNFVGASTDDLIGSTWRWDDVHFNEQGLREHADRWFDELLATFDFLQFVADFNSDDVVDAVDLVAWTAGYGISSGATLADGDADGDEDVDGKDFLLWQHNFGQGLNSALAINSSAIPEPSTSMILLIGSGIGGFIRTRQRPFATTSRRFFSSVTPSAGIRGCRGECLRGPVRTRARCRRS